MARSQSGDRRLVAPMAADQTFANRVTKASGSNFYYSFLFLPRRQREAIHALYAFCRAVDDSVDGAGDTAEAERRVAFWREELAACYGGSPTHPITRALAAHLRAYPIRRTDLEEVIAGVAMDITPRRYATYEDLRGYCQRVASSVGLACIEIFGCADPAARDYAVNLGLAFQMTNILRDVRRDAEVDRVYLPLEDLSRFGCPESDLRAATPSGPFTDLMRFESARARALFAEAKRLLPDEERANLLAAEIMGAIYEAILDEIERRDHDVLARRVSLSAPRKLAIATRCYLRARSA